MGTTAVQAQEVPDYSQFGLQRMNYNPALAGTDKYLRFQLGYRLQYVTENNQPEYGFFQTDMQLNDRYATGLIFDRYQYGSVRSTVVRGVIARTYTKGETKINVGAELGLINRKVNFNQVGGFDPLGQQNAALSGEKDNAYGPTGGLGLWLNHKEEKVYGGVSILNVAEQTLNNNQEIARQYVGSLGSLVQISEFNQLRFDGIYRYSKQSDLYQGNVTLDINQVYQLGAGLRNLDTFVFVVGFRFSAFSLSYSYDWGFDQTRTSADRSQELMLSVSFDDFRK